MKVDEKDPAQPGPQRGRAFTDALRQVRPATAPARRGVVAGAAGHAGAVTPLRLPEARAVLANGQRALAGPPPLTTELGKVRVQQDAQHQVLTSERGEALGRQESDALARVKELVRRELLEHTPAVEPLAARLQPERAEAGGHGGPLEAAGTSKGSGAAVRSETGEDALDARVDTLVALAERIELMLKAQRPQLAVQVGGSLQAQVLIERTGRGEVALTVQGRASPPAEPQLQAVREALGARGLRLSALRTA